MFLISYWYVTEIVLIVCCLLMGIILIVEDFYMIKIDKATSIDLEDHEDFEDFEEQNQEKNINKNFSKELENDEYNEFINYLKYKQDENELKINLAIYNIDKNSKEIIIISKSQNVNEIYYDSNNTLGIHEYSNAYYTNSLTDMRTVVQWMLEHQDFYK